MSIQLGNIAELEFLLQATRRGLIVSRPSIQATIYDFLVDNGKKIYRIQVKSNHQNGPNYRLKLGQGSKQKNNYSPEDVDIIAAFIGELKTWYIFPIYAIGERMGITLYPDSIDSKWNKYREGWGSILN